MSLHSPLVDKDEFAIDGMSGDVLRGLHPDISQAGLGDNVGVQTADSYQAAQVATFIVRFVVLVQTHFGRWPTLQVTRAVDCAEALAVSCDEREGRNDTKWTSIFSEGPSTCCGDDGELLQFNELEKD